MWEKLDIRQEEREKIVSKRRSFLSDVWFRFSHKPTAIAGLMVIVLMILFAILTPSFTSHTFSSQVLDHVSMAPWLKSIALDEGEGYIYVNQNLKLIHVNADGTLGQTLTRLDEDDINKVNTYAFDEETLQLKYGGGSQTVVFEDGREFSDVVKVKNKTYLLGTDTLGRDILTRLAHGTRISLLVAFLATAVNMIIGILYGGIAGYKGGNVDGVMMRIVDIISAIPLTLYVILIMVIVENGMTSIIIALSSVYWVNMARVVRGQILSLKEQEFISAALTIGSSPKTILMRHLIPNSMGPILVTATMLIPQAIFMEAFLSYLGLGVQPPMASLGTMCNDATEMLRSAPYQLFLPAAMICLIMFAFNFVGDGLRDALDPQLRK